MHSWSLILSEESTVQYLLYCNNDFPLIEEHFSFFSQYNKTSNHETAQSQKDRSYKMFRNAFPYGLWLVHFVIGSFCVWTFRDWNVFSVM